MRNVLAGVYHLTTLDVARGIVEHGFPAGTVQISREWPEHVDSDGVVLCILPRDFLELFDWRDGTTEASSEILNAGRAKLVHPAAPWSAELQARMQSEVGESDAVAEADFKARHDGMDPMQYVVSMMPLHDQERIARTHPHLIKKPPARR